MSSDYPDRREPRAHNHEEEGPMVLAVAVIVVLAAGLYLLVSRFHVHPAQLVEVTLYFACLVAAAIAITWYLKNRRKRIENAWPHPPISIPMLKDRAHVQAAAAENAVVLGYDVHRHPWLWPDQVRVKQGLLVGQNGAGKTTLLDNIIAQDLRRVVGTGGDLHRIPMVIIDGKGDKEFLNDLLPEIRAAGRLDQLRILDPSRPDISVRYNPCYSPSGAYLDHSSLIFESFRLEEDFFKGHQATYFNDLSRVLWHTGKQHSIRDILVMAMDEQVMKEQIEQASRRIERSGATWHEKDNFGMSVHLLSKSFEDKERISKIQGLLNQLMTFIDDQLSVISGSYEDLLTLDDVIDQELILFVSLNTNRNPRAVTALGRMVLQNLQLMVGQRYENMRQRRLEGRPMVSVVLDEFAPFAYPNFSQILQTARGSNIAFLFSLQSVSQLLAVGRGFQEDVLSAPNTIMAMHSHDEETVRYFCRASSRVTGQRKTMKVERKGLIQPTLKETGDGNLADFEQTLVHESHIKKLPVGQMQILQADNRLGMVHSHLHVRRSPTFELPGFEAAIYPRLVTPRALTRGANLHFKDPELIRRHARGGRSR